MTAQPAMQSGSERRRAGGGRRGRGTAERQTAPAPAFIERKIPFFDFLSEDQVEAILGEADRLGATLFKRPTRALASPEI